MPQKRPDCSDFIIAAVRTLRRKSSRLKPGTAGGAQLERIFQFAKELYTAEEVKKTLEKLMDKNIVIVLAKGREVQNEEGEEKRSWGLINRVSALPSAFPNFPWYLDLDTEKSVDPKKADRYRLYIEIRVYLKEDGLPLKVEKFDTHGTSPTVQKIISNIKKRR